MDGGLQLEEEAAKWFCEPKNRGEETTAAPNCSCVFARASVYCFHAVIYHGETTIPCLESAAIEEK